jgi:transcriptional regulator GlxA family with amidase domain
VITGAGVSAGIDMALILASKIAGQVIAQSLQLAIEYDPAPPFDSGSPEEAPHALVASLVLAFALLRRLASPREFRRPS